MGAPSAQVQQGQTSGPVGKGAGMSPSTDRTTMTMGGLSGQPGMGAPNSQATNFAINALGGDDFRPVNRNFVAPLDGATNQNPFPNTIGSVAGGPNGQPMNQTMGKGFGGGAGGGKGSGRVGAVERGGEINPLMAFDEGTGRNPLLNASKAPTGPGATY